MERIICLVGILLSVSLILPAQEQQTFQMAGTVYNEQGTPLAGVTIYLRDKISIGTTTSDDGRFSIRASRGDMLVFKYVGYEDLEYLVTEAKSDIEMRFVEASQALDEVVVVGL